MIAFVVSSNTMHEQWLWVRSPLSSLVTHLVRPLLSFLFISLWSTTHFQISAEMCSFVIDRMMAIPMFERQSFMFNWPILSCLIGMSVIISMLSSCPNSHTWIILHRIRFLGHSWSSGFLKLGHTLIFEIKLLKICKASISMRETSSALKTEISLLCLKLKAIFLHYI